MSEVINIADLTPDDMKQLQAKLSSPLWRINNLYYITDKKRGATIPFRPNIQQQRIIHDYYVRGIRRFVILKARRLGFSTLIALMMFDAAYWGKNIQCSIVDQTSADAEEKLRSKVKFAWENLSLFKEPLEKDNEAIIQFSNGSVIQGGKNARGGTNHMLHISEWGPIAHKDPKRSEEIKTGALPSADEGAIFIESTFKGGKGGHFYELLKTAQETPEDLKTVKDYYFYFFPWFDDPGNALDGDARVVQPDTAKYLEEKEAELGKKFTKQQKIWYQVTKNEQGIFMMSEYPTTVDEAYMSAVEGSIYGDTISKIRSAGQILDFKWDRNYPVFAVWDIGWSDDIAIWLFQIVGRDVHWIRYISMNRQTASEVMRFLDKTEIPISGHFLPWDAASTDKTSGINYKQAIEKAGALNVKILPPTRDKWALINEVRGIIPRSQFHKTYCKDGIEALEHYHTKDTSSGGIVSKEPVHDWSSHASDSFGYGVVAILTNLVKTKNAERMRDRQFSQGEQVDFDIMRRNHRRHGSGTARSDYSL